MNTEQMKRVHSGQGFIAALDESGGSTPKTLARYGVSAGGYVNEEEMFKLVHGMRARIIQSPAFTSQHILGAILFEDTMDRKIDDLYSADFLWEKKGVVPFLKIDKGLAPLEDGVSLMKPLPDLAGLLRRAKEKKIFGTKMRSFIANANPVGIAKVVKQQFEVARQIIDAGFVPIIEPEVDINSPEKKQAEAVLKAELLKHLATFDHNSGLMLKLTIPTEDNLYKDLTHAPGVLRVVALSGGYERSEANEKLARNHGLIASFSRALLQGLHAEQTESEFNEVLANSIQLIYKASI